MNKLVLYADDDADDRTPDDDYDRDNSYSEDDDRDYDDRNRNKNKNNQDSDDDDENEELRPVRGAQETKTLHTTDDPTHNKFK